MSEHRAIGSSDSERRRRDVLQDTQSLINLEKHFADPETGSNGLV